MQVILFVTIGIFAIMESWLQPWISLFGVPIPLILLFFAIGQVKIEHKLLPWLGLWVGFILDVFGVGYFGVNMLFYLGTAWVLSSPFIYITQANKVWIRVGIVILLAFIQPWYLLLANRQFDIDFYVHFITAMLRAALVAVIALSIVWVLIRRQGEQI